MLPVFTHQSPTLPDHRGPLAGLLAAMMVGFFAWQCFAAFTSAPERPGVVDPLLSIVETVIGPGRVRLAPSNTTTVLVLIDGPENGLTSGDRLKIESLIRAADTKIETISIQQFPFAAGAGKRQSGEAVAELGILSIMTVLSIWLALTHLRQSRTPAPMYVTPPVEDKTTSRPTTAAAPQMASLDTAGQIAAFDPDHTAAIIHAWLRGKGNAA